MQDPIERRVTSSAKVFTAIVNVESAGDRPESLANLLRAAGEDNDFLKAFTEILISPGFNSDKLVALSAKYPHYEHFQTFLREYAISLMDGANTRNFKIERINQSVPPYVLKVEPYVESPVIDKLRDMTEQLAPFLAPKRVLQAALTTKPIKYASYGEEHQIHQLSMVPYFRYGSLQDRLAKIGFPEEATRLALDFYPQLVECILRFEKHGLVFSDMKNANLMRGDRGEITISDIKSIVESTDGLVETMSGVLTSPTHIFPEYHTPRWSADKAHAWLIAMDLYQCLMMTHPTLDKDGRQEDVRERMLRISAGQEEFTFDAAIFKSPIGEHFEKLIWDATEPNPQRRIGVAEIGFRLTEIKRIQAIQDKSHQAEEFKNPHRKIQCLHRLNQIDILTYPEKIQKYLYAQQDVILATRSEAAFSRIEEDLINFQKFDELRKVENDQALSQILYAALLEQIECNIEKGCPLQEALKSISTQHQIALNRATDNIELLLFSFSQLCPVEHKLSKYLQPHNISQITLSELKAIEGSLTQINEKLAELKLREQRADSDIRLDFSEIAKELESSLPQQASPYDIVLTGLTWMHAKALSVPRERCETLLDRIEISLAEGSKSYFFTIDKVEELRQKLATCSSLKELLPIQMKIEKEHANLLLTEIAKLSLGEDDLSMKEFMNEKIEYFNKAKTLSDIEFLGNELLEVKKNLEPSWRAIQSFLNTYQSRESKFSIGVDEKTKAIRAALAKIPLAERGPNLLEGKSLEVENLKKVLRTHRHRWRLGTTEKTFKEFKASIQAHAPNQSPESAQGPR